MNLTLLCLVLFTAISSLQCAGLDASKKKGPDATVEKVVQSRRGTWRPRGRIVGWGANKRGGAMRIKDGDRKTPARNRPEWAKWRKARGARRSYRNTTDEEFHARIFEETEAMVAANQAAFASGEASYELGINEFSDYSEEEIAQLGIGKAGLKAAMEQFAKIDDVHIASRVKRSLKNITIDWRSFGVVGPIKSQGGCGSCYAFSAIGAIESQIALTYGVNVVLSEQQAVDCSGGYDNDGCDGGWMANVFNYVNGSTQGLVKEQDYPYQYQENSCSAPLSKGVAMSRIERHVKIQPGNEADLEDAIFTVGPVSIAMNLGADFMSYRSGVYNNYVGCGNTPAHAMLLVGMGTENGLDYYIMRNSWGEYWGDKGYIKIRRGVNCCGIADWASYPVLL